MCSKDTYHVRNSDLRQSLDRSIEEALNYALGDPLAIALDVGASCDQHLSKHAGERRLGEHTSI